MYNCELRFMVDQDKWFGDRSYKERFLMLLALFQTELARNGLTLEGGSSSYESGCVVCRVIAQDENAIYEKEMGYDTKKALSALLRLCDGQPEVCYRDECIDIPHCSCRHSTLYIMQAVPEWLGSPVMCSDCRNSVPLYRIVPVAGEREFDDLLHWRRAYRGYITELKSGLNAHHAHDMLNRCVSDFSLLGRRLAGLIEANTGVLTAYPLYAENEKKPERCPQCGGEWHNPYKSAIPYDRFCRACRLVM